MNRHERPEPETSRARPTLEQVAEIVECFETPCLLENSALAALLESRGRTLTLLGAKDRSQTTRGFKAWDVRRPTYLERVFDVVVCDAMDPSVSLRELRQAVRVLTHFKPHSPLMIACPTSRKDAFLRVFSDFNLTPSGLRVVPDTVSISESDTVEYFANFDLPT